MGTDIHTKRLTLRRISLLDIPRVYEILSDERVVSSYGIEAFSTVDEAEEWVKKWVEQYEANGLDGYRWAICQRADPDVLIGSCGFHNVNRDNSSIEIGYELNPRYWRGGVTTEAVQAMLKYCFTEDFPFNVNRVAATTDLDGAASIALLERLGFEEEGILRSFGYWRGSFHDVRLYSLIRNERL